MEKPCQPLIEQKAKRFLSGNFSYIKTNAENSAEWMRRKDLSAVVTFVGS